MPVRNAVVFGICLCLLKTQRPNGRWRRLDRILSIFKLKIWQCTGRLVSLKVPPAPLVKPLAIRRRTSSVLGSVEIPHRTVRDLTDLFGPWKSSETSPDLTGHPRRTCTGPRPREFPFESSHKFPGVGLQKFPGIFPVQNLISFCREIKVLCSSLPRKFTLLKDSVHKPS